MPFPVAPTQRLALAGSEKENKKLSLALAFFFLFIRLWIFFFYSELSNPGQILRRGAWPPQELPGVLLQVGFGFGR